ncbi:hypothetical protein AL522_03495 (plasmid) [Pantoea vagans]|nr:hypothetical protein AL522_03495 [Pantoea vagans]
MERIIIKDLIMKRTGANINEENSLSTLSPLIERINIFGGIENFSTIILSDVGSKVANAYISTKTKLIN